MEFVSITEARRELPSLVESAEVRAISKHGRPVAVLMSYDAYEAMRADLELLRDPQHLLQIERDHERFMAGGAGGLPEYSPETGELRYETGSARPLETVADIAHGVRETPRATAPEELAGPSPREFLGIDLGTLSVALERVWERLARLESRMADAEEASSVDSSVE